MAKYNPKTNVANVTVTPALPEPEPQREYRMDPIDSRIYDLRLQIQKLKLVKLYRQLVAQVDLNDVKELSEKLYNEDTLERRSKEIVAVASANTNGYHGQDD